MSLKLIRFLISAAIICSPCAFAHAEDTRALVREDGTITILDPNDKTSAPKSMEPQAEKVKEEKTAAKEEPKAEEKSEEKKEEPKAEEKSGAKEEEKAEEKKEEAREEPKAEEEVKEEPKPEPKKEHPKFDENSGERFSMSGATSGQVEGITLNSDLLSSIYSSHNNKTLWFDGKKPNGRYQKAMEFIALADENGLNRQYFDVDTIEKRVEDADDKDEDFTAKTDALITQLVAEEIQQIGNGHVITPALKVETYFQRPVRVPNATKAFEEFLSGDAEEVIDRYSPKHPQYLALRNALHNAIEREGANRHTHQIIYSADIKPGFESHQISEIRRRLGLRTSADPKVNPNLYDKNLIGKVVEFQRKFKQKETGIIDEDFIDMLNKHDMDTISRIKANMERYRWLPDELPKTMIDINLADFKLHAFEDGKEVFTMSVISGREEHKTPIMQTRMYQFIINPYWNVPKNYFLRNMLPLLKQDPNYVKQQNFDLLRMEKKGWKNVDQSEVDLNSITEDNYNLLLRQRPGNINVLGPIKFAIVNPFDVYIHFTSEPWLFTNQNRGYSSGCIRIEDPVKVVDYLRKNAGVQISDEEFNKLFHAYDSKDGRPLPQKKEMNDKYFKFKTPITTYTTYFTAHVDESGNVSFVDDLYELDFNQSKDLGI